MNWDYIAGFFDGEGSAGVYNKRTGTQRFVAFSNTHRATLEDIRNFMGCGRIYLQHTRTPAKPCYVLRVQRIEALRIVVPELLSRCGIKRESLTAVLVDIDGRVPMKNVGLMDSFGVKKIDQLYGSGMSISQVAREVGVTPSSMNDFMVRNNIPKRTRQESYALTGRGRVTDLGRERVVELYAQGHTLAEIGLLIGVTPNAVWTYMKRQSIPRRTRHESRKMRHAAPIG